MPHFEDDDDMPDGLKELLRRMGAVEIGRIPVGEGKCPDCGDEHPKASHSVDLEAQAMSLHEALIVFSTPKPKWKPGDMVRYRKNIAPFIKNPHELHMVMEVLDEPLAVVPTIDDTSNASAVRRLDTIIGVVTQKGAVVRFYTDARELEAYPGADKLSKPHS